MFTPRLSLFRITLLLLVAACGHVRPDSAPVDKPPQRIISVVPSVTEMLFALGIGDKVIAVGDYDRFPPEVATRQRIGGLINPNIEKIIELKPDLVISYGTQDVLRDRLSSVGIRLYPFTHGSVAYTLQYMLDLGRTVGAERKAQEIVGEIRAAFDELRAHAPAKRPRVLLIHNRGAGLLGSFYTVGSRAFQHDLIEIAGGTNLFGDVDKEVLLPSLEEVIRRAPEIILETVPPPRSEEDIAQRKRDWQTLGKLPAVANDRIYIFAEDYFLLAGARLHLAARRFAEIIKEKKP